jgi:hypothetical protein
MMRPLLSFFDVYGDAIFCSRGSPTLSRWLSADPLTLNARTGNVLTMVGAMPVVCSRGGATPGGLRLLRDAGFEPPPTIHTFGTEAEYFDLIRALVTTGRPIVQLHVHAPDEIPDASSWVPRDLLTWLNNKAHLGELIEPSFTPKRRTLDVSGFAREVGRMELPVVVKAATSESTGGGGDVRICRKREDLEASLTVFAAAEAVVLEELIEMTRSMCLNYAILCDSSIEYLGSAEQICDETGLYHGNWIDDASAAPVDAVDLGFRVGERALEKGYRGVYGVDVAELPDGSIKAFDLNFRANGSTGSLLYRSAIARRSGNAVMRLCGWKGRGSFEDLLRAAYTALRAGYFLPYAAYDPSADGFSHGEPRLGGVLLGASRDEIVERQREISALGLV